MEVAHIKTGRRLGPLACKPVNLWCGCCGRLLLELAARHIDDVVEGVSMPSIRCEECGAVSLIPIGFRSMLVPSIMPLPQPSIEELYGEGIAVATIEMPEMWCPVCRKFMCVPTYWNVPKHRSSVSKCGACGTMHIAPHGLYLAVQEWRRVNECGLCPRGEVGGTICTSFNPGIEPKPTASSPCGTCGHRYACHFKSNRQTRRLVLPWKSVVPSLV